MYLPKNLSEAIEEEVEKTPLSQLVAFSGELTERYRSEKPSAYMTSPGHRIAYLTVRLPATFAAITHVLQKTRERLPELDVETLLDVGAGPGTGMWAAAEVFPQLKMIYTLEQDRELIAIGKRLCLQSEHLALRESRWSHTSVEKESAMTSSDLVLASYLLGELNEKSRSVLLSQLIQSANKLIVLIEPGTPAGFARIRQARETLIAAGLTIIAPCPHQKSCPIQEGDWCHFAARVERSSLHRRVKEGSLGHEDEKFSYVVASKTAASSLSLPRIVRHPRKLSKHVQLALCTDRGLENLTVTKKDKERYRKARKSSWGELFL